MEPETLINRIGDVLDDGLIIITEGQTGSADITIVWANAAAGRMIGVGPEALVGADFCGTTHLTEHREAVAELLLAGKRAHTFLPVEKADDGGLTTRRSATFTPLQDNAENARMWLCQLRDVTGSTAESGIEPMTVEGAISDTRLLRSLLDQAGLIVFVKHKGRFVLANQQMGMLFDKDPEWFVGKTDRDFLSSGAPSLFGLDEAKVIETGRPHTGESSFTLPDGSTRTFFARAFALEGPDQDERIYCCAANDITHLRATEHNLTRTRSVAVHTEERLRAAIDHMKDGFVLFDRNDRIVLYNQAFRDMHGAIGPHLKRGMTFREGVTLGLDMGVFYQGDLSREEWIEQHIARRQKQIGKEMLVPFGDGRWMLRREMLLPNGEIAGFRIDVTEIKKKEQQLEEAQQRAERAQRRLQAAIEALGDSFMLFDNENRLAVFNENARALMARTGQEIEIGLTYENLIRNALDNNKLPDSFGREEEWLKQRLEAFANPTGPYEARLAGGQYFRIFENKTDQGDTVSLRVDITKERSQQQQLEAYAADLKRNKELAEERNRELEKAKGRIEQISLHDPLTGLANRRYLDRVLEERLNGQDFTDFALLHLDLDKFKEINDTMGHAAGDAVLIHVAGVLRDAAGETGLAARIGGDEFVLVSGEPVKRDRLAKLADKLILQLNTPIQHEGQQLKFGGSVGIAQADNSTRSGHQLLINADLALYRAKALGRNRAVFFTDDLEAEVNAKKKLADEILKGVERGEFVAYYQPQFDAQDWSIVGVEALIRWQHPTRGIVTPFHFLDVAEDLGLLRELDQMMLQNVIRDRAAWTAAGIRLPKVSINVSGSRLRDQTLVSDIREAGFEPGTLSIELLEAIFLDDDDSIVDWTVDQLTDLGVSIELDDFGTGHSSIVGLIKLRPSTLKIDRQFIAPMLQSEENRALVGSIVEIGHSLNVKVTAEGVETQEQAEALLALNCDRLQGYYFSKPLDLDDLIDFVSAKAPRRRAG